MPAHIFVMDRSNYDILPAPWRCEAFHLQEKEAVPKIPPIMLLFQGYVL